MSYFVGSNRNFHNPPSYEIELKKRALEKFVYGFIEIICSPAVRGSILFSWGRFIPFDTNNSITATQSVIEPLLFAPISFSISNNTIEIFQYNEALHIPRKNIEKNQQCKKCIEIFERNNDLFFDIGQRNGIDFYKFKKFRFNYIIEKCLDRVPFVIDFVSKMLLIFSSIENRLYFQNCVQTLCGCLSNIIHKKYKNQLNDDNNNIKDNKEKDKNNIDNILDANQNAILVVSKIIHLLSQPCLGINIGKILEERDFRK